MPVDLPTIVIDSNGQVANIVGTPDVALETRQAQMLATIRYLNLQLAPGMEMVPPTWTQA